MTARDYEVSKEISALAEERGWTFAALLMACFGRACPAEAQALRASFPGPWAQLAGNKIAEGRSLVDAINAAPAKVYSGQPGVVTVEPAGWPPYNLKHHVVHSPTGLGWGYGGSGAADLALSILLDLFGEDPGPVELRAGRSLASRLYQDFKWKFIAAFGRAWSLPSCRITAWLEEEPQAATIRQWLGLEAGRT